jgi:hypothetical protein
MARSNFVKAAQKDIYTFGKHVKYESKKGKRAGQELTKLDRTVPKDKSDIIFIAKGESYYWWQFKNSGKHFSKTAPKPSQLTQSNYLSQLYSIRETIDDITAETADDLQAFVEDVKSQLEDLKSETESSLENMPDSLQSSPTGELLQERIDALDNAINEFDNLDLEYSPEEGEEDGLEDWINEKIEEISGISLE